MNKPNTVLPFGQTLKDLLALSQCSHKALADALNYSPSLIGKWINDNSLPNRNHLTNIFTTTAQLIVTSAQSSNRTDELIEHLQLTTKKNVNHALLIKTIVGLLHAAYQNTLFPPLEQLHEKTADDPLLLDAAKIIESLKKALNMATAQGDNKPVRIFSTFSARRLMAESEQIKKALKGAPPFIWHHILTVDDNYATELDDLGQLAAFCFRNTPIHEFRYAISSETGTVPFLYIENTELHLRLNLYQQSVYQCFPFTESTAPLMDGLKPIMHESFWPYEFVRCGSNTYEEALLYFSNQKDLIFFPLNIRHLIFSSHPSIRTLPLDRATRLYLYFLHQILDGMGSTCIFPQLHTYTLSAQPYFIFSVLNKEDPALISPILQTLSQYPPIKQPNRYYFFSESPGNRTPQDSLWVLSPEKVMFVTTLDTDSMTDNYLTVLSGSDAWKIYNDMKNQIQIPYEMGLDHSELFTYLQTMLNVL